jgi:hypothetical protein
MEFKNPANGHTEEKSAPWLWTLLFGGIYLVLNGAWAPALIWFLIGCLLYGAMGAPATLLMFVVGIIYSALATSIIRNVYLRKGWIEVDDDSGSPAASSSMKKCPACAELIKAEATICRYCDRTQPEPIEPSKEAKEAQMMALHGVSLADGMYLLGGRRFITLAQAIKYADAISFANANHR